MRVGASHVVCVEERRGCVCVVDTPVQDGNRQATGNMATGELAASHLSEAAPFRFVGYYG